MNNQLPMFQSASVSWNPGAVRGSLDELFQMARKYRSSKEYFELLQFISRFQNYSMFNALLVHTQMPGATFVAPASRWARQYRRRIKLGAHPLVILKPMGPVMFVFDVSDTEPEDGAAALPSAVINLFAVKHKRKIDAELNRTIENAKRDGVKVANQDAGSMKAGSIQSIVPGQNIRFLIHRRPQTEFQSIPLRYGILLNANHDEETQYASLAHELAHLYCGHLGSPNEKWWPNRENCPGSIREIEAESVSYLVCERLGIKNPSEKYLFKYVKNHDVMDSISLDCVIKSSTLIEQMGREWLSSRRENVEQDTI